MLADGRVLIAGGASAYNPADPTSAEVYDPGTGTFKPTGSMTTARNGQTATLLPSGKVLFAGGGDETAELYDPATGSFTSTGSMLITRWGHTATLLATGKVLIAGGCPGNSNDSYLASAELYDPATGSFSPTGPMSGPRFEHAATLLTTGRVLIAGGMSGPWDSELASAELYDPATGSFSPTGPMTMVRTAFTAALLQSGQVLIAEAAAPATKSRGRRSTRRSGPVGQ